MCYSEMVNSEALIRNNMAAQALSLTCKEDRPLAMQVFGARVESMQKAAEILCSEKEFDFFKDGIIHHEEKAKQAAIEEEKQVKIKIE